MQNMLECGLSQSICRRWEQAASQQVQCEYAEIMLPSMFVLHQKEYLRVAVTEIGFQGRYDSEDLWEWFKGAAEGFGREWYSNWMATWQWICTKYRAREWQGEEDDSKISRHSSADTATDDQREWQDSRISRHSSADTATDDEREWQESRISRHSSAETGRDEEREGQEGSI